MASIFTLDNQNVNYSDRLNIDELYENIQKNDVMRLETYTKMLNKVHIRIKMTSRQNSHPTICWFLVPEIIIGVPHYDHASCIAFLIDKLKTNGFAVRYTHPNMLLISWGHYVPSYVRDEIKKKTGIHFNENGEKLEMEEPKVDDTLFAVKRKEKIRIVEKENFTPKNTYKPSGKLIYNNDFLNRVSGIWCKNII